jgi:VanZ family protein
MCIPGSVLPNEQSFKIPEFDKFVHVILFGGFVFLWCFFYSSKKHPQKKLLLFFFYIFIIAVLYGIGMEFAQKYWIPFRDYSEKDIIADMIGAGLAYGISNITLTGTKDTRQD